MERVKQSFVTPRSILKYSHLNKIKKYVISATTPTRAVPTLAVDTRAGVSSPLYLSTNQSTANGLTLTMNAIPY